MDRENPVAGLDLSSVPTPCYIVNTGLLKKNLQVLRSVKEQTGATILLALKGFALFSAFPLVRDYLDGVCASGPFEARLGRKEFGKQVHTYAPAYSDGDLKEVMRYSDHVVFNSLSQWEKHKMAVPEHVRCGLRINPQFSEVKPEIYNPCGRYSRLGITAGQLKGRDLTGISGLHFHTHCEQNADALERSLKVIETKFGPYFKDLEWVNFGGGHHITRPDYQVDRLCRLVNGFKDTYGVEVILEPGEAVALGTGVLVATVLDIVRNEMDIAILDTSAAAHMPDVLEMPYRPRVVNADEPGTRPHTYRLGGLTCLAGDVIGDYSFDQPLTVGARLVFLDMAHYTMVKNNTFNGMRLPSIGLFDPATKPGLTLVRQFGYDDYRNRLS